MKNNEMNVLAEGATQVCEKAGKSKGGLVAAIVGGAITLAGIGVGLVINKKRKANRINESNEVESELVVDENE